MGGGKETGPAFRLGRRLFNHLKPRCAARQPKSDRQQRWISSGADQLGPRHGGGDGRGQAELGAGPSWPRSQLGGAGPSLAGAGPISGRSLARAGAGPRAGLYRLIRGGGLRPRVRALRVWFLERPSAFSYADGLCGLAPLCPPSVIARRGPRGVAAEVGPGRRVDEVERPEWAAGGGWCATAGGADHRATGKSEGRGWAGGDG